MKYNTSRLYVVCSVVTSTAAKLKFKYKFVKHARRPLGSKQKQDGRLLHCMARRLLSLAQSVEVFEILRRASVYHPVDDIECNE